MIALLCTLLALAPSADPKPVGANFDDLKPLAAALAAADAAALYEGLPHQTKEKELLEAELEAKETVERGSFPFYAEPLALKPADAKALTALAADSKSFQKWGGPKLCGGFHPDYLVEWAVGEARYRLLVCFGCHEVRLLGPKAEVLCDMTDAGLHGLEKLLRPYRKNRPKG